ncbi:hypothetical protein, partial [Bacillus sp. ST24]|uniref:hypothetical protein n=1 Tax=Bacillus sp. ST24 TaxID=2978740 RepID=UPI003241E815|nr:hypothetical protein [Bacillus sp. ST24]
IGDSYTFISDYQNISAILTLLSAITKIYRRFLHFYQRLPKYIGDSYTFISDYQNISTYRQKMTIKIGCSAKGTAH